MKEIKMIQLIRYTMHLSLIDTGKYPNFVTSGQLMDAQEMLEASK